MRVLVVEDDPAAALSMAETVRDFGYHVDVAHSVVSAWTHINAVPTAIVIADWNLGGEGTDGLCRKIRAAGLPSYTYVVAVADSAERAALITALGAGADDFVPRPFEREELRVRLQAGERIAQLEHRLREANENLRIRNEQLHETSRTDPLMQIGNRAAFDEIVERVHHRARADNASYGLIMCDLDHFKCYNDTFGHQAGDQILRRIASSVKLVIRANDWAFRYGGEEIALLLDNHDLESARSVAERVRRQVEAIQFELENAEMPFRVTVSCGVASYPENGGEDASWRSIVEHADQALYAAKRAGRNQTAVLRSGVPETSKRTFVRMTEDSEASPLELIQFTAGE